MVGWDGLDMEEFENDFKSEIENTEVETFVELFDTIGKMNKSSLEIIYAFATMVHNLPNYELKKNLVEKFISKFLAK